MRKKYISFISSFLGLTLAVLATSCGGGNKGNEAQANGDELSGRVSLSGAFALYPLAVKWAEDFQKIHPNVRIDVEGGGAGKGMTDALAGQVDFGMVSREVSDAETAKGALGFPVAKDAVVPTINENNPLYADLVKHGITQAQATDIWINGTIKTWGQLLGNSDATAIAVFTRSDACGAAETWAKWLGKHQEDLLGEGVNGDPGVANAVQKNATSIGLNNIGYAYDNNTLKPLPGIRVLPVDANANGKIDPEEDFYASKDQLTKAIADGKYPSPPARDLYLVSNGVPTNPAAVAFLKYALTEGQKANEGVGYITIPQEKLDAALQKLK
ncbi:MAG: PstS family phosphate ABC transporter substrate-binding protein [Bacteroidales bacterium]|nr:PstS family phosphate ABC transporter substrate-binding protein [Candidatus Physcocola equi]